MVRWAIMLLLGAAGAEDSLAGLPQAPTPMPIAIAGPTVGEKQLAPGIAFTLDRCVVYSGTIALDQGPSDGLEKLACLRFGKVAESLIRLDAEDGVAAKAACIAALGLRDGTPAEESVQGVPGRGMMVSLMVEWADEGGTWWRLDASCLVRDRLSDRAYPPLPWVYTGSGFVSNGEREVFLLDACGTLAAIYDEDAALLASPFPDPGRDDRYEVNSALVPSVGTPVRLVLARAEPGMRLWSDPKGDLSAEPGGSVLDEAGLDALLAPISGSHIVQIMGQADAVRSNDVRQRQRILAAAGRCGRWITPLFCSVP
jgi:hypothetical protein